MIRHLPLLAVLLVATPVLAESEPPYYGPGKHWHGIGYVFGYTDKVEKDGSWRIEARVRHGEALNVAMYRAAEKARENSSRYVQILRASEEMIVDRFGPRRAAGGTPTGFATVWARPSASADAPHDCPLAHVGDPGRITCYTADVAEVMRVLGGPNGRQPGLALVDHLDSRGRSVLRSAFGVGMVDGQGRAVGYQPEGRVETARRFPTLGSLALAAVGGPSLRHVEAAPTMPAPTVVTSPTLPVQSGVAAIETQDRFDTALHAQQPVRGRNGQQGWTISD